MKVEAVVDATGLPLGVATDGASAPEAVLAGAALAGAALADIPPSVPIPDGVPVVADRAYDSDPLRGQLADDGFVLVAPHRKGRKRPPTADGRRLRRYRRRYIIERTFAWRHSYRRVVPRFERYVDLHDGFVHLACAFIALNRLVK
jgi:transposase